MANGNSNKTTDAAMTAEAVKLGTAYGAGQDAWPMLFQKFGAWGFEGVVLPADKGADDKVKTIVAEFLTAAGKAQTLAVNTIATKETEMRTAVKLGAHCATVKVDVVKLITNVRDACYANRNPGKGKKAVPTMQTLNAFSHIANRFVEKKAAKLWTTAELQPLIKAKTTAAPKALEVWKEEARRLGVLTGLISEKLKAKEKGFAKKDTDENSVKVAAAVIAYVNKMVDGNGKKAAK
jgi:hypothetical protein